MVMQKTGILRAASSLATCGVQDADLCPALHKSLLPGDCIFLSKNTNLFKKKKKNSCVLPIIRALLVKHGF